MQNFSDLFIAHPDSALLYAGSYSPGQVLFSVLIAIFSSYAALEVSQHLSTLTLASARRIWIAVGGLCLGVGIWAMHFVGMLAFDLPCTTSYDPTLTLLSAIPGLLACILAMKIISHNDISRTQLALGGLLLGAGIGAMHYAGMAAMRLNGLVRYDIGLFLLSIVVAVLLATLALWIRFRVQSWASRWSGRVTVASAVVMGLAISGMHYTAMAAAYFVRDNSRMVDDPGVPLGFLTTIVLSASGLAVVATLLATYASRLKLSSLQQAFKIISLVLFGWAAIAWFGTDVYYSRIADEQFRVENGNAEHRAEHVLNEIGTSTAILRGITSVLSQDDNVRLALRRFGADVAPSALGYKDRRQRWSSDRSLRSMNNRLHFTATGLALDNIFLLDAAGDCVASGNAGEATSIVGLNYADSAYFSSLREGRSARQYAIGRTNKVPGLYYAAPVIESGRFIGAVVVKRNIKRFAGVKEDNAFIADNNGVIVLAPDASLEFKTLPAAPVANLPAEKRQQLYLRDRLEPLTMTPWKQDRFPSAVRIDGSSQPIVLAAIPMPEGGISVYIMHPLQELVKLITKRYWIFFMLAASGSLLIIAASAAFLYLLESQRASAEQRIAATAFESQEGMMITDADSVILRVNRAFTGITGYSAAEIVGQTPRILKSGRQGADFYAAMWERIRASDVWEGEIWNRRKNGEVYPEHLTITAVKDRNGNITNYVATFTDITMSKAAADEIHSLAFYDPLTHLPNRRLLLDRLQQALASSTRSHRQGALLFIDLDNFKILNDTLGHDMGDLLLLQVAKRLSACVRESDTVARLGGDEFVVMLEDLNENTDEALAHTESLGEKILANLNQPYQLGTHVFHSTASIGAILFSDHLMDADDLFKRADIAMYQAKKSGRNALRFFNPQMQDVITARAALEDELRQALVKHQFRLHYQLQVDNTLRPVGAEALLRWVHPERGLVPPAQFIGLAEETGLILPIGQWVLETACAQLRAWQQDVLGRELSLSVNISARQFRQADFVDQVRAAVQRHAIDPKRLKLELTESMLLENIENTIAAMSALKDIGVRFSLDDFGTGYSSLQYLKRLPLDQLKIDQSFVRDIAVDSNDQAIVRTIIAMAHSLNLDVIAEGVETEQQRQILQSNGCTTYQGYLFSRPVPIEQFETLLKQG